MNHFRVYFNRRSAAPLVWSIDDGNQANECNVAAVVVEPGCGMKSHFTGEAANDTSPVAWMEIEASYYAIRAGIAFFFAAESEE